MLHIKLAKTRIFPTLFLSAIVLSACGSLPALNGEATSTKIEQSEQDLTVGTNGELIYIQSDNVSAAGYDEVSMVMTVQFDRGAIYEYYGVPAELWTSFVAAQPHPWSQVGYPRLVQGAIPYKRIG
jgi:hypothetical protein